MQVTRHHSGWVSPFGHPRITARLTTPRGISQPPTSFIGPWYPGIHHVPYTTWPQRCSRPLYSSQTTHTQDNTPTHHTHPTPTTGRTDTDQACPLRTQQRTNNSECFHKSLSTHNTKTHVPSIADTPHHTPTHTTQNSSLCRLCDTEVMLLRKEVIQPHLPVRLPCYDFVPIASPTFDHSPHKG